MVRCDRTIAVTQETKERLHQFKIIDDETFDNMINRLITEVEQFRKKLGKNRRLDV